MGGAAPPLQPPNAGPVAWGPAYYAAAPRPTAERPTAAMVLSIIGGVFVIIGGVTEVWLGAFFSAIPFGPGGGLYFLLGFLGVAVGVLTIVVGILLEVQPHNHTVWGILLVVFAIISLSSFFGGYFLGFVLTLVGGILAITWRPAPPMMYQPPIQRICPKCGRVIDPSVRFCPFCGNPLG
jgi:hypothetical protein